MRWMTALAMALLAPGSGASAQSRTYTDEDLKETSPSSSPEPSPASAVAAFAGRWREHGRRLAASHRWWSERHLLVVAEHEVARDVVPRIAVALREQLAELGSTRIAVEHRDPATALAPCIASGVLDTACFGRSLPAWRQKDRRVARSVVLVVTNAGIGSRPTWLPGGYGYGPPAGQAFAGEGWAVLSELYLLLNTARLEPGVWAEFSDHARSNTVKHELVHLLGLPHHGSLENPGLPEPPEGEACRHVVGPLPKAECLMRCGSGDDDWAHQQTHGRGFGLCARCRLAAESVLAGIEGR